MRGCAHRKGRSKRPPLLPLRGVSGSEAEKGNRRRQQEAEKPSTAAVRLTLHEGGAARNNSRTSRLSAGTAKDKLCPRRKDRSETGRPSRGPKPSLR